MQSGVLRTFYTNVLLLDFIETQNVKNQWELKYLKEDTIN